MACFTGVSLCPGQSKSHPSPSQPISLKTFSPRFLTHPHSIRHRPRASTGQLLDGLASGLAKLQRSLQLTPPPPGFPPGPRGDVVLDLLRDPLAFLEATQAQHGDVVGITLGGEQAVLVTDPAAAKAVLVDNPETYVKAGTAFFPGSSLAGNGLLVSDGEEWRRQRQLAAPAFRRAAVARYGAAMVGCTEETLLGGSKWRAGAVRDVYADFNELTLQITLTALFGAEMRDSGAAKEVTDSIREAFEYFSRRAATAFAIPEAVPTPDNLKFTAAVARLDRAVYGLIAQRRADLEASATMISSISISAGENGTEEELSAGAALPFPDLLTALLLSRVEGNAMSDRSLRDELMTLLVAGQETSAILLGWTCGLLASAPAAQQRAAAEVIDALNGALPTPQDAQGSLPFIEACVLEALRVRPPAYLVGRCVESSTTLAGFSIPAGTTILVSPYIMHRDVRWWGDDATAFRPERWLDNNVGGSYGKGRGLWGPALAGMGPNGAYIPFGAGQRNCIGTGFAMMEAVLVLAAVLQKFELRALSKQLPAADPRITLRPTRVRLLLRARSAPQ